jgi:hypothetical protein
LWSMLPDGTDPAEVLVVMGPARNAWAPLAAWFRCRGARVVPVPPERSADLPDRGILDFDATGANPAATACYADAAFVAERFRFIEARREIRT